ncbi:MAG TPA: aminotransferase class III-fold pyridoxal phosphate-dependent enzyme, partial [Tepidisphaeraceae bacterium]|nr:aminotransferase class III-fold pyridoxal phosphate-dependent enzyme [Tepidisphaeraceae bacterium]
VMYARPDLAALLTPGKHGCTLGGNPICMAAATAVFDVIERDNLLTHARTLGGRGTSRLKSDASVSSKIAEVRGRGLFLGIELKESPQNFNDKALAEGVIINLTAGKVIRLAPPMNISDGDWDEGLSRVIRVIAAL